MAALPEAPDERIIFVPWHIFILWFASVWQQGQHVTLVGHTGCGKTTLAICLERVRNWVVALDAKGGDETLAGSGFTPISSWPPPRKIRRQIGEGRPARMVAGFSPERIEDVEKLKLFLSKVLDALWIDGSWTIQMDELQIFTDPKMMGLRGPYETFMIAARNKKASIVSLFQAPAWVPTASTRQATWIFLYRTRNRTVIKALADIIGWPWQELEIVLKNIPPFHCILCQMDPFEPLILTCPPKVA